MTARQMVLNMNLKVRKNMKTNAWRTEPQMAKPQSTATVLRAIADDRSLELFTTIARETVHNKNLKTKLRLTRKKYYSRLSRITRVGLVRKRNGTYIPTAFGRVVYQTELTVDNALNNSCKPKAIDSLKTCSELPQQERQKLLDALFDNHSEKHYLLPPGFLFE
jgi:hypothetical protein